MRPNVGDAPFQHGGNSVAQLMQLVIYALVPGIVTSLWFFGIGILLNISIACCFALLSEAAMLWCRRREVAPVLRDRSVLLTAVLFAIAIPPGSTWSLVALGIIFAVVVAKHLFGGLGQNPFNPAMCGYAMLMLAFPLEMTSWHVPSALLQFENIGAGIEGTHPLSLTGLKESLLLAFPFLGANSSELADGLTMATPLIEFKMAGQNAIQAARESGLSILSHTAETGWELVNIAYLLGGLFLLYRRVIGWQIPVSIVAAVLLMSALFYAPGSATIYGTPYLHLFGSATMLGAFFIATDPVSAATTPAGKIVYGIVIGVSIYAIRVWGSYLDSIAFAVLFGNFCAPLIDHYCRPRIFGRAAGGRPLRIQGGEAGKS